MLDKLDAEFAFGREALDVRAYRQELLSSNIANADTPGYRARDVDFASSLAGALKKAGASGQAAHTGTSGTSNAVPLAMAQPAGVSSGMSMSTTEAGHMAGNTRLVATGGAEQTYGQLMYRNPTQPSLDGNTVDLDSERVQFADNTLHYESGMTVLSQQIKQMLAAITSGS
ncbi:flagellar basal body rod protein FlgB [Trinickia caryophylli]|uniref:Flagellar basal body rod protein FlgB n=1 Tax=Trinickia caryophylli TaxID=28094 RepID=A0A1X7FH95_TRICW|nr:flagellar basal body rod protein FlgB [Trinickia caryophylli]PMS13274.1 flagellar basal body rod protein FlgB [Trinickia caryophylli]TRX19201.1 flagellar basal body rod protein FlgB [Trinickia caryophylli]WQE13499.1 flagellar basal body rod protein FlgB [Trinickia caryophylli]SMF51707.1 flagellar basal-body rod protein FlgB [Trinickia caryophylli]GLU33969.1 flagellar basal body rod protein FlgB [Trinickia caryophylli]